MLEFVQAGSSGSDYNEFQGGRAAFASLSRAVPEVSPDHSQER